MECIFIADTLLPSPSPEAVAAAQTRAADVAFAVMSRASSRRHILVAAAPANAACSATHRTTVKSRREGRRASQRGLRLSMREFRSASEGDGDGVNDVLFGVLGFVPQELINRRRVYDCRRTGGCERKRPTHPRASRAETQCIGRTRSCVACAHRKHFEWQHLQGQHWHGHMILAERRNCAHQVWV